MCHKEAIFCVVLPQYRPPAIIPWVRCRGQTERCLRSLAVVRSGTLKSDTEPHKKALHWPRWNQALSVVYQSMADKFNIIVVVLTLETAVKDDAGVGSSRNCRWNLIKSSKKVASWIQLDRIKNNDDLLKYRHNDCTLDRAMGSTSDVLLYFGDLQRFLKT